MPTFFMLKAKFINHDRNFQSTNQANSNMYIPERKHVRLVTFYRNDKQVAHSVRKGKTEKTLTKDTLLNRTSKDRSSTSSSHAHSDGSLHAICRHKRCMNRRQSLLFPRPHGTGASFQDIDLLRRKEMKSVRQSDPVSSDDEGMVYDDKGLSVSDHPVLRITLRV